MSRELFLLAFVPFGLALFRLLPVPAATATALISSAIFLPELTEIDPPLVPPINKHSIGALVALLGCLWVAPARIGPKRFGAGSDWLIVALVASAWVTVATNGEAAFTTAKRLDPLGLRDGISMGVRDLLLIGIPYYLGRCLIRTPRELNSLFTVLVVLGLAYGVLILYESRMSPQLHRMLYGLHPNNFSKVFRLGGYRPMVFMESGLAVAIFMWTCAMAGFGLMRARLPVAAIPGPAVSAVLAFLLAICRSLGALLYGFVSLPALALTPRRAVPVVIAVLVFGILAYPTLRFLDLISTDAVRSVAARIDEDRADSLAFRFLNEDQIVERTKQKVLFGWGGFLRSRVQVDTLEEVRAADGFWVIMLGQRGLVGLGLTLALLVWPQIRVARRLPYVRDRRSHALLTALALIVGVRSFDMLPNGLYGVLPFFLAGALFGVTEWKVNRARRRRPAPARIDAPPPRDAAGVAT